MSNFQFEELKQLSSEDPQDKENHETYYNNSINYGNIKVLVNNKKFHMSIGPDYLFTIFAFAFILVISYALYKIQKYLVTGIISQIVFYIFMLFPPVSFLYVVFSNPGVYDCYQNDEPRVKYCENCKVFKPKKVYHCDICNACIQEYDHHCPWLSKCVGKKNIVAFYIFISSIPLTFIFFFIQIYRIMSISHEK